MISRRGVLVAATLLVLAGGSSGVALAASFEKYVEGQHYLKIDHPVATRNATKVEVIEMFSYGCPHCSAFEPALEAWRTKLPADVDFYRIPVGWNPQFRLLAQAYYAANALKLVDKTHKAVFDALHIQNRPLTNIDALADFYAQHGANRAAFVDAMNSFGVRASLEQGDKKTRDFGVTGVPSIIVGGKYLVSGREAGTNDDMLNIASFLIDRERIAIRNAATH